METNVEVHVRVRPGSTSTLDINDRDITLLATGKQHCFDHVYSCTASQAEVYEKSVAPLVDSVLQGYNATVLAYGQTGSGKSYTIGTLQGTHMGAMPRALREILARLQRQQKDARITLSFIEIYNEELRDLLGDGKLAIRERADGGVFVSGAVEVEAQTVDDVISLVQRGAAQRATEGTRLNDASSRSHAILTATVETRPSQMAIVRSKLHCVDLAGSERARKSHGIGHFFHEAKHKKTADSRFKEGIHINAGLLALGKVIAALCDKADHYSHIPYRESKLTRVLQDSLGGRARTVMIACVSPELADAHETATTLSYAARARNIRNRVVANAAVFIDEKPPIDDDDKPFPPPPPPIQDLELALARARADLERDEDIFAMKTAEAKRHRDRADAAIDRADAADAAFAALQAQLFQRKPLSGIENHHPTEKKHLEREIRAKEASIAKLVASEEEAKRAVAAYRQRVALLEKNPSSPELGDLRRQADDLEKVEKLRMESDRRHAALTAEAAQLRSELDNDALLEKRAARWLKRRVDDVVGVARVNNDERSSTPYDALARFQRDLEVLPSRRATAVLVEASRHLVALRVARHEDLAALDRLKRSNAILRQEKRNLQLRIDSRLDDATVHEYEAKISCLLRALKDHEASAFPPPSSLSPSSSSSSRRVPSSQQ